MSAREVDVSPTTRASPLAPAATSAMDSFAPASRFPCHVALLACLAALNNVAFGYDVGVVSGSLSDIATSLSLTTFEQELATSGLNFVSGVGALVISGNLLDLLGRSRVLLMASLLLIAGGAVVAFSRSLAVLLLGRALQGLGSGCGWCACSVYITEIAPSDWRGALVSIADISINFGILLGYAIDRIINVTVVSTDMRWRVAMGISIAFPLFFLVCYPFCPETPRWLALAGELLEGKRVLKMLNPALSDADAAEALEAITTTVQTEAATISGCSEERPHGWKQSLCPAAPNARRLVMIALALGLTQQLTGTEGILYYTPRILNQCENGPSMSASSGDNGVDVQALKSSGGLLGDVRIGGVNEVEGDLVGSISGSAACVSAQTVFIASIGVGICKFVGEVIAAAFVDKMGRRKAMVGSNLLLSVLVFTIGLKFALDWPTIAGATSLGLVMLFFSLGPGPLTFVVVNEILPLTMRGHVVAVTVFFNRLASGTIALTFLSLKEAIGVINAFSLYAGLGLVITFFYWFCVPDLTGMTLEHASSRSFISHVDPESL